jgi:hypothetical protein
MNYLLLMMKTMQRETHIDLMTIKIEMVVVMPGEIKPTEVVALI